MNILYEGVTRSSWPLIVSIIISVVVGVLGLLWIILCLSDEGEWTNGCTAWIAAIGISAIITSFIYDTAPKRKYIRVDISSITNWDAVIEKYYLGDITGKVLELTEKETQE